MELSGKAHNGKQDILTRLKAVRASSEVMLATVSGVGSTKPGMITFFDKQVPSIGLITTKSFQVTPNPGNREPIITEPEVGNFGNSVGLRNPGMAQALEELAIIRKSDPASILNVSVSASSIEDFIILVKGFGPFADILELNFSCPHASSGYGASIGCDPGIAAAYMREIREAVGWDFPSLIFPKLTPNVDDIGKIAAEVVKAGADGISAINTVGPEVYREPNSGSPILNNKLGGKGGQSGQWIHERALECIADIRKAVGPDLPIIGMGGVADGRQAADMVQAGADVVGIGSALGMVHQRDWPKYLTAVKEQAELYLHDINSEDPNPEKRYIETQNSMEYLPFVISKVTRHTEDISIITLDGEMDCGPGEYAFIWLPGVGEKPFSIAENSPLTFIVKSRGPFTAALLKRVIGDTIYVRGVYGEAVDLPDKKRAVMAAGGTGIAVLPSLAKKLKRAGIPMTIYYGTTDTSDVKPLLENELGEFGSYIAVADDGIPGRVLNVMKEQETASGIDFNETAWFFVGPEPFMAKAAHIVSENGADKSSVMLSMERPSMCGIGLCGECACGDRLTCQYGTFVSYQFLEEQAPELLK